MSNTFKTSKSLVLMAALLALLASPVPGMAATAPVDLGLAGNFAILAQSEITDVPLSAINGNVGLSPAAGSYIAGLTCPEVTGTIYTVNAAGPGCQVIDATLLGLAVEDMTLAYADAALRAPTHPTELGGGDISGLTLAPGVWRWSSSVVINSDVTLSGGPNDVWILQISGDLNIASKGDIASGIKVKLAGGARAANVFWQVAGVTTLGTYSTFNGTILGGGSVIALQTGATLSGRVLSQFAVTLQQNTITTIETKTQCEGFLKAEATVFNYNQKTNLLAFQAGQKTDLLVFQAGQKFALQAFVAVQTAAKLAFMSTTPPPTAAAQKTFNDLQHSALQAFQAVQKTALQVFQFRQNTAKQAFQFRQNTAKQAFTAAQAAAKLAFQAEQKIDMQECNTLP